LRVKFFNFKGKSESDIQNDINSFIEDKNIIDIKMTCTVDVDRMSETKHVQILVMYEEKNTYSDKHKFVSYFQDISVWLFVFT